MTGQPGAKRPLATASRRVAPPNVNDGGIPEFRAKRTVVRISERQPARRCVERPAGAVFSFRGLSMRYNPRPNDGREIFKCDR